MASVQKLGLEVEEEATPSITWTTLYTGLFQISSRHRGYMQLMDRNVANYATFDIINRGNSIS
jgi:hypothetical protein